MLEFSLVDGLLLSSFGIEYIFSLSCGVLLLVFSEECLCLIVREIDMFCYMSLLFLFFFSFSFYLLFYLLSP